MRHRNNLSDSNVFVQNKADFILFLLCAFCTWQHNDRRSSERSVFTFTMQLEVLECITASHLICRLQKLDINQLFLGRFYRLILRNTWENDRHLSPLHLPECPRADCVHTLLSEVCTAPHRKKKNNKKNLGRSGDENRWWNSVRNTREKNNRHLLVKPNLVPPSHSSRVQLTERRRQTDRQTAAVYLYVCTLEDRRSSLINTD